MKLLLTGFDPFGGEPINPAWEAVKRVSDQVGDVEVVKLMVPTVFLQIYRYSSCCNRKRKTRCCIMYWTGWGTF